MRRLLFLLSLLYVFLLTLSGQTLSASFSPLTGDANLDLSLQNLNVEANADLENFVFDLSVTYAVPVVEIETLIEVEHFEPAEVFLALELSEMADEPLATVVTVYKRNRTKGWGAIAKELGIKPGSKEFKALKGKSDNMRSKVKKSKGNNNRKKKR